MVKHAKVTNRYSKGQKSFLYKCSASVFVLFLSLTLSIQLYILYLSYTNQDITISSRWLPQSIPGYPNWAIHPEYLKINLRGEIKTSNLKFLSKAGYQCQVESIHAQLDLFQLLKGALGLKELKLRNLYLLNEKNEEVIAEIISLCLSLNARSIHLEEAYGKIANVQWNLGFDKDLFVNFERFLAIRNWRSDQQEIQTEVSVSQLFSNIEEWITIAQKKWIKNGSVDVMLSKGTETLKLSAHASLSGSQNFDFYNINATEFIASVQANISPLLNQSNAKIKVHIPSINHPHLTVDNLHFHSILKDSSTNTIESHVSGSISTKYQKQSPFYINNRIKLHDSIYDSAISGLMRVYGTKNQLIQTKYSHNLKTQKLRTTGYLQTDNKWIEPIQKLISFPQQTHPILVLNDPLHLKWDAVIDAQNRKNPDFDFHASLNCKKVIPYGVPMENVKASITANPDEIHIYNIHSDDNTTKVRGSFYQNFNTLDFRILVKGYTFPHLINPWLNSLNFWAPLWEDIRFPAEVPYADFDISGRWGDMLKRDIFGQIESKEISYKGIEAQKARAVLRSIPKFLEIYNIEAYQNDKAINGNMNWVFYPYQSDTLTSSSYNFESTLALSELLKFMPENLSEVLSHLKLNHEPWVSFQSKLYKPIAEKIENLQPQTIVTFKGKSSQPLHFYDYPLDNIKLEGNWKPGLLTLNGLKFGIAGGKADAVANIEFHDDKDDILQFSGILNDADGNQLIRILEKTPKPNKSETPFRISLKASGKTNPSQVVDNLVCNGDFTISGPKLQEFHLLGALSKVLSKTPIAFSSVKFNKSSGNYTIKDKILDFSLFRMEGNTHRLDANGKYSLETDALDFRAKLFLLGGLKIPVVQQIINAVNPIAHVLEFSISGTLKEPKWRFLIDPRNIFDSPKEKTKTNAD